MSRSYTTLNTLEDPSRPVHQKILEDRQTKDDHVVDVLHVCRRIMDLARASIYKGVFQEGSSKKDIVDFIIYEARMALQYRRQRKNIGGLVRGVCGS